MARTYAHKRWRDLKAEAERTGSYTDPAWRTVSSNGQARLRPYRRRFWGATRTAERTALARGVEPEPTRTRNGISWDIT